MIKKGLLLFLGMTVMQAVKAQQFDNKVYDPHIRTVQCYNSQKEQSFPVLTLGSSERLSFSFDDLSGGSKNYWYTLEHCTYDWKSSGLSPLDYLEGSTEDRITDYAYSAKTLQKYTHYTLTLPNEQLKPKISGNYVLMIYEDGDRNKLVCTQRVYLNSNQVSTAMEILPSNDVALRFSNQKVNATISYTIPIPNPETDIKLLLLQNADPLTAKLNVRPNFVRPGALVYNDVSSNDFQGNNEFRQFDFRSLRYKAEHVRDLFTDSINHLALFTDQNGNLAKYTLQSDQNGSFFVRNQDNRDNDTDSDYGQVQFSLKTIPPGDHGDIYVVGRFNNFLLNEENKMSFDSSKKMYSGSIYLKQGVYDYQYVWKDNLTQKTDLAVLEGSFVETENDYQALIYYRRPGSRWDELIGYTTRSNVQHQ